jgi:hypothetical protein
MTQRPLARDVATKIFRQINLAQSLCSLAQTSRLQIP